MNFTSTVEEGLENETFDEFLFFSFINVDTF